MVEIEVLVLILVFEGTFESECEVPVFRLVFLLGLLDFVLLSLSGLLGLLPVKHVNRIKGKELLKAIEMDGPAIDL